MSDETTLGIHLFDSPKEAPVFRAPEYLAAKIDHANVVRNGTTGGKSTVDLVFVNESGQKFIAMTTGRLIRALANMIGDEG